MRIPIHFRNADVEARRGEPLTFGVPFGRGQVSDDGGWILTCDGAVAPVQMTVLDRWSDGSIRWGLVDVCPDVPPGETVGILSRDPVAVRSPRAAVTLSEADGRLVLDTGAARFTIGAGPTIVAAVDVAGGAALGEFGCVLDVTDASGRTDTARFDEVVVEARGPVRAAVRLRGQVSAGPDRALDVTCRLHVHAGLPTMRIAVTVCNPQPAVHPGGFWDLGDPGSVLIRDLSLRCAVPGGAAGRAAISLEPAEALVPCAVPLELYQDSSGGDGWNSLNHLTRDRRVSTTFRGFRFTAGEATREGWRADPILRLDHQAGVLSASARWFWQTCPNALEATPEALTIRWLPRQSAEPHELQGGEQTTREAHLAFADDPVSPTPLGWTRVPVQAAVDPTWIRETSAVPFLWPLPEPHAALVDAAVDGPDSFASKREVIDEYGWRHFGDLYGDHEAVRQPHPPLVSHYNNQYDPLAGFVLQFLRSGDPRWMHLAEALARHVIDIDVYHTTGDKSAYNGGLFWHTYHYGDADIATHRTYPSRGRGATHGGGPSADHNYTTGLMLFHFMTGDSAARETAIGLADYVIRIDDGRQTVFRWLSGADTGRAIQSLPGYFGPGRGPANSVNALLDGFRLTGDVRYQEKADLLVRRVVHPTQPIGDLRLDEPEIRWFYTMFLQSLGKYLHDAAERGDRGPAYAYARACLLHFARWMAEHERPYLDRPEKLQFPTETWAAQDIRKSDVFCHAALHSRGDDRTRFVERAEFFHRHAVETLAAMPQRVLTRPLVILLTSGQLLGWLRSHPAATMPDAERFDPPAPFRRFVPQRESAVRRARGLAVAAAGGLLALALTALLAW